MSEASKTCAAIPDWLKGVLPVLPTPFTTEDEVDYTALASLVNFAKVSGVTTLVTPAFGSEFYKLDGGERQRVIETAVAHATQNNLRIVVQCNHSSPRSAAKLASEARGLGASAVSTALPRTFAASERQLLDYAQRVCDATDLPVIVQDWNPAGRCSGPNFFISLHRHCANFCLAKLEEPGIGAIIRAINAETSGRVGVISGWGGSYVIQLHGAGLCGLMPGLALADAFVTIWSHLRTGNQDSALKLFAELAPYLQFSLQTFEQFHHAEKRLLIRRGALSHSIVRPVTVELDNDESGYLDMIIERLLRVLSSRISL